MNCNRRVRKGWGTIAYSIEKQLQRPGLSKGPQGAGAGSLYLSCVLSNAKESMALDPVIGIEKSWNFPES